MAAKLADELCSLLNECNEHGSPLLDRVAGNAFVVAGE